MKKLWILVLALVLLTACAKEMAPIEQLTAGDSPMGPRKTMNYDGHRYAFLENGAEYNLEGRMGEVLGVLAGDILADPETFGKADLASTFAQGGTVRVLEGKDPRVRVAVELEGKAYLCENVDTLDGSDVDLSGYLAAAKLEETAEAAEILDHMGLEVLGQADPGDILGLLQKAAPAQLTEEGYAAIGQSQTAGESFRVQLKLADGTDFGLYLIPQLDLAMVGDNKYTVTLSPELEAQFADRPRITPPMN